MVEESVRCFLRLKRSCSRGLAVTWVLADARRGLKFFIVSEFILDASTC